MKQIFISLLLFATVLESCNLGSYSNDNVLNSISFIDSIKMIHSDTSVNYKCTYEIWFKMPIDHENPMLGTFPLRAYYSHLDFNRPMVAVIDGYTMYTSDANELSKILNSNQLTIEHRFFSKSRPVDSIPWKYLTVNQAAADAHQIIQAFKKFYKGKWISTGISKSGQTTIFHRSLYPNDVDASVPYVAPLNFSNHDPRIYDFLSTVGTPEIRKKVLDFQLSLFRNKKQIMPYFKKTVEEKGWIFKMGVDRAYDLSVLEYAFAFWQWGIDPESIPAPNSSIEELYDHLKTVNTFTFFEESEIETIRPFFFQAMTEVGMYGYDIKPFTDYLPDTCDIIFDFTMPKGWKAEMNPATMLAVDEWVREKGNNMLYIYGEYDAWSSTAVTLTNRTNSVKMINPKGCHTTRIENFPVPMRDSIYTVLEQWLKVDLSHLKQKQDN